MWVVTTDEFDPISQEFENERDAQAGYEEFIEVRNMNGHDYRVYLAKVVKYDGGPAEWKRRK